MEWNGNWWTESECRQRAVKVVGCIKENQGPSRSDFWTLSLSLSVDIDSRTSQLIVDRYRPTIPKKVRYVEKYWSNIR